jgi:uncharacterized membrane protein YgaE (UPF0421/DUF939 family)
MWVSLLQTAVAAGLAWYVAHNLVGHQSPFFAPIAAVVALGVAPGNHVRRALEIVLGVGFGIAIGDLIVAGIGRGSWQLVLVVFLAMTGAVLLGGSGLVVSQAASSGVLVVTISASAIGAVPTRFVDALVGGGLGLVVLAVAPRNPARTLQRAVAPLFADVAAVFDAVAAALESGDSEAANDALRSALGLDPNVTALQDAAQLAGETILLSPLQRRERGPVERYHRSIPFLGSAVRNTRVLARAAVRAVELEPSVPAGVIASVRELAATARLLETALHTGEGKALVRVSARTASAEATDALEEGMGFAIGALVGQIRSIAADFLLALGLERPEVVRVVREARVPAR